MEIDRRPLPKVLETAAKFGGVAKFGRKKALSVAETASEMERVGLDLKKAENKGIQLIQKAGKSNSKSLYLCFSEVIRECRVKKRRYSIGVAVESIKLNLSDDGCYSFNSNSKLRREGYQVWEGGFGLHSVGCTLFGNPQSIVFLATTDMLSSNESNRIWVFEGNKARKPMSESLLKSCCKYIKRHPLLVELQGKLYALATVSRRVNGFEEFDPTKQVWDSLPDPPEDPNFPSNLLAHPEISTRFSLAIAGDKILYSTPNFQGVRYFDIETKEWKTLSSMGNCSLPFQGKAFVHHRENDGGFLMFKYNYLHNTISVFLMSHQFEPLHALKPVELPELPRGFILERSYRWAFAHLGGDRKFCILLNNFSSKISFDNGREPVVFYDYPHCNKGVLFVITFEYDVMIAKSESESEYKILNTHQIEYEPPEHAPQDERVARNYYLRDAFVLNNMEDEDTDAEDE